MASRAADRARSFRTGFGRVSETRIAWLTTKTTRTLAINHSTPEEVREKFDRESEVGDSVYLSITVPGRTRPLTWDLTGMTTEELEATRKFFDHLFDLADPVVRERDRVADEAHSEGDDSYDRVYRELPTLVTRQRKERTHGPSVQHGPEDASGGHGDSSDPAE